MVAADVVEHLAVDDAHAVAYEDVVDLAVRAVGGPRPALHGSPPSREEPLDAGAPEVAVTREHRGAGYRTELARQTAELLRWAVGEPRSEMHGDDLERGAVHVELDVQHPARRCRIAPRRADDRLGDES